MNKLLRGWNTGSGPERGCIIVGFSVAMQDPVTYFAQGRKNHHSPPLGGVSNVDSLPETAKCTSKLEDDSLNAFVSLEVSRSCIPSRHQMVGYFGHV
jgi:hypothetical protein